MGLVVADVQASMDRVASITANMGGWTVSSERADDFSGRIAVRVPADRLLCRPSIPGPQPSVSMELLSGEEVAWPSCGVSYSANDNFCTGCGASLKDE